MGDNKDELTGALGANLMELQAGFQAHCRLVRALVGKGLDSSQGLAKNCPVKERELRLKGAIQETIEVLEQTRQAFKSKRLERLRKELTRVLAEV